MKTKKLILAGFLAMATFIDAQAVWTGAGTAGNTSRTGNTAIGLNTPAYQLDVQANSNSTQDGIYLNQIGPDDACIYLDNTNSGQQWMLESTGSNNALGGGYFIIRDNTNSLDRFIIDGTNGYVGVGVAPAAATRLHVIETAGGNQAGEFNVITTSGSGGTGIKSTAAVTGGAVNGQQNVGIAGDGSCNSLVSTAAIGVSGSATGALNNYGGFFSVSGSGAGALAAGVYGKTGSNSNTINTGIFGDDGSISGTYAGHFSGKLRAVNSSVNTEATLILQNTSSGSAWSLQSLGSGSTPSGAHFRLLNGSTTSMFVNATTNNFGFGTSAPQSRVTAIETSAGASEAGYFEFKSNSASICKGVTGYADLASTDNFGVNGTLGTNPGTGLSAGVYGEGSTATNASGINAGIYGILRGSGATINAAVYGEANGFTGGTDWACYFNGNTYSSGFGWNASDLRFKKNIVQLKDVSEKLIKLNGYTYEFKQQEFKKKSFDNKTHHGFIAQELKEVFPELVMEDSEGYYAVNYVGLIPVLLEGIKEQIQVNKNLREDVVELQKKIDLLANNGPKTSGSKIINNSTSLGADLNLASMETNNPNPFTHETTIQYNLPSSVNSANLVVYDLSGRQLSSFPIAEKGTSSITITSEKLAAGIYLYSIVADGKLVDTKRMVVVAK